MSDVKCADSRCIHEERRRLCPELSWIPDAGSKQRDQRASHKFHKKPARTKGDRGQSLDANLYAEGTPFATGRKGGIKRELYT